jgi:hypothetical protein
VSPARAQDLFGSSLTSSEKVLGETPIHRHDVVCEPHAGEATYSAPCSFRINVSQPRWTGWLNSAVCAHGRSVQVPPHAAARSRTPLDSAPHLAGSCGTLRPKCRWHICPRHGIPARRICTTDGRDVPPPRGVARSVKPPGRWGGDARLGRCDGGIVTA